MRIGLLGVAHMHVDAYLVNLREADAEVVGVTDHDADRGRRWAADNGVPWYASADDLLGAGVDGVVVCSETVRHRHDVELAAAAGVAVLCEKPLAITDDDARAIVDVCERAGVPLATAFPMRFSPQLQQVGDLIASGSLGTIWAVHGTNQAEVPARHRSWFVDPAQAGGGALMDHVVHLADILRWYLGRDPVEVYAATNRVRHSDAVPVETGGLVMLTYDDGTFASIDSSWSRPAEYPRWGGLELELVGERGVVAVDGFSQHLVVHGGADGPLSWPGWGSDPNQGLIDDFLAVVQGGGTPRATGVDGLFATRIALAALRSADEGRPVALATS